MGEKYYRLLLCLFFAICLLYSCKEQPTSIHKITGVQQKIDSTLINDTEIDEIIKPFRNHLNKQLDSTLCIAPIDIKRTDGALESTLGNLMADISIQQTQPVFQKRHQKSIDFVLLNYGGIRAPIPKGPVTARTAFEVMPFENELVVAELSYAKVMELISYLMDKKSAHPTCNLELSFEKKSKKIKKLLVNGKPLEEDKSYFVLTTDYLQQGGDSMSFFKDPIQLYKTNYKLRNALIDYFKGVDTLKVQLDKRVGYAE